MTLRQIEQQYLGLVRLFQLYSRFILDPGPVTHAERRNIDVDAAARDMHVGAASTRKRVSHRVIQTE